MANTPESGSSGGDIVKLGIAVDSSQPEKAADSIDKLKDATINASVKLDEFNKTAAKTEEVNNKVENSSKRKLDALQRETAQQKAATDALKELEKAQQAIIDKGTRLIAQTRERIETFNMDEAQLLRYHASQLKVSNSMEPLIKRLEELKAAKEAASHSSKSLSDAFDGVSFSSSRARSEIIVLAHEIVQGRFTRIPASMMVLAEYTNFASVAFSALGATAIAAGIAIVGALVEMGKGAIELDRLERSLILTGNAAGLTRDSLHDMAETLSAGGVGVGIESATEMLEKLAATGKFTHEELGLVGQAALDFAHLSGESADKVVGMFADMENGVANWAEKMNRSYHFITVAQYDHIDLLEKEGQKQEAMIETMKAFNDHTADEHARKVGTLVQMYRNWVTAIQDVVHWLKNVGAGPTTQQSLKLATENAANLKERIQARLGKQDFNESDINGSIDTELKILYRSYQKWINESKKLSDSYKDEQVKAASKSESAEIQADAVLSSKKLNSLAHSIRTQAEKRKDAIAEADADVARVNAGYLEAELARQGLSYKKLTEQARDLDSKQTKELQLNGQERVSNRSNEFKRQLELAEQFNIGLKFNIDQRKKLEDAAAEKYKDRNTGRHAIPNDGRKQALLAGLNSIEGDYDSTKRAVEANAKLVGEARQAGMIESKTYYDTIRASRNEELAALNSAYQRKVELLNNYNARNKVDAEENKKRLTDVANWFNKEKDRIANAGSLLDLKQTAEEKKDIETKIKQVTDIGNREVESLEKRIVSQRQYNAEIGKSKEAKDAAKLATLQFDLAQNESDAKFLENVVQDSNLSDQASTVYKTRLSWLQRVIEKQRELSSLLVIAQAEDNKQLEQRNLTKQLDEALKSAHRFETGMKAAFGNVGKAIGEAVVALAEYNKRQNQIEIDKQKSLEAAGQDPIKQAEAVARAEKEATDNKLQSYADLTDAMKGFFSEQSNGYKMMDGLSKVAHAVQVAMMLKEMAMLAQKAIMNQASSGDPYTAWARMAAMAAAMAALGFAVGGGFNSGGNTSMTREAVQKANGTGTVLGDSEAKSQSIMNAMNILSKNSNESMPISLSMLKSLQSIESAMSGLTNFVLRTTGLVNGNGLNVWTGSSKKLGGLWGKSSTSIEDSGLTIGGTDVASLMQGLGIGQFVTTKTNSSSWFGLKKSTSFDRQTGAVDAEVAQQIGKVFSGVVDSLSKAAGALGFSAEATKDYIKQIGFTQGTLSLRGLKGKDLEDAINAFISNMTDQIAQSTFRGYEDFQRAGEGYFETIVRVSNGYEKAKATLDQLGMSVVWLNDIENKQGDVAEELVRKTIVNAQTFNGTMDAVAKIMNVAQGSAEELVKTYKALVDIAWKMHGTGLNWTNLSSATIAGAGGISELGSSLSTFIDKYFTPEEKQRMALEQFTQQLHHFGVVTIPKSREEFKSFVQGIDTSTEAGQRLQGQVLSLADMFDQAMGPIKDVQQATEDLTKTYQSLTDSIMDEVRRLRGLINGSDKDSLGRAQADFAIAVAQAQAGDQNAAGKLPQLSQAVSSLAETQATSSLDLKRILATNATTLEGVAALFKDKYGVTIKGFAGGGDFYGGYRVVGENGPEIEATGPSRIFSQSQTSAILSNINSSSDSRALKEEVSKLRAENKAAQAAIARNTEVMAKILFKYDVGTGILTTNTLPT